MFPLHWASVSLLRGKQIRWCVLFPCNLSQHSWWPNINQSGVMKLGNIFWDLDWVQSTRRVVNVCRTGSMIFDYFELLYLCSASQKHEISNLQHRELNVLKEQGRYKTTYVRGWSPVVAKQGWRGYLNAYLGISSCQVCCNHMNINKRKAKARYRSTDAVGVIEKISAMLSTKSANWVTC